MLPADFGKLIAEETEKWAKVISAGNIMPEPWSARNGQGSARQRTIAPNTH
jgi:hypothetical protein